MLYTVTPCQCFLCVCACVCVCVCVCECMSSCQSSVSSTPSLPRRPSLVMAASRPRPLKRSAFSAGTCCLMVWQVRSGCPWFCRGTLRGITGEHIHTHTHTHTFRSACMHKCAHIYTHARISILMHTYTQITRNYVHTYSYSFTHKIDYAPPMSRTRKQMRIPVPVYLLLTRNQYTFVRLT